MRLGGHWHPWDALRQRTDLTLIWCNDLPGGRLGATDGRFIWIRRGLDFHTRRSVLTHELSHIDRRLVLACDGPDELTVDQDTARKMIVIPDLAEVLKMNVSWGAAASELAVDIDVLQTRMRHLHISERAQLRRLI